jgi:rare lipoprotein A
MKLTRTQAWILLALTVVAVACCIFKPSIDRSYDKPTVDTLATHGIASASWYGKFFHGRTTRYGEVYDMNGLTTACNHLPYNTRLLVTNMANNKSVVVRVTDTGAFRKVYLDLSRAAFMAIADTGAGIITVEIRILK